MVVVRFHPKSGTDRITNECVYVKLLQRLHEDGRYGVLRNQHSSEKAEDCYLVPAWQSASPSRPSFSLSVVRVSGRTDGGTCCSA
jgi:hypothetical protein